MKKRIKARYIVYGAVILTIALLIVSFLLFAHSTGSLIEGVTEENLIENTKSVAAVFNTKLNDQLVMLESQVRYFREIDLTDYNAMKNTIINTKGIGEFKNIGVANRTGATINYNGRSSGNILLTDYFREAMNGSNAISKITYIDEDGEEVLVLAVPIEQDARCVGVVYGTFTKTVFNSLIKSTGESGNSVNLLLDDNGNILASTKRLGIISEDVRNFNEVLDINGKSDCVFSFTSGGEDRIAVITPVGVHDWSFVSVVSGSVVTNLSSDITINVLKIVIVVAVSFLLLIGSIILLFREIRGMAAAQARIGAELGVATKIQSDMMPYNFPERDDISLYATMTPAKEVGGDFYDFFFIDDDHLALVMADVAGKGVPAALFMVITKSILRNVAMMSRQKVGKVLSIANNALCENSRSGLFVTTWFGVLTISTGELVYANAGHEYPAIKRGGDKFELVVSDNSPPLSAMEDLEFDEERITLSKGDCLFVYTDGVPEAKNAAGERFGTGKMLEILNRDTDKDLISMLKDMKQEIDDFTGKMDPFDDVTMMALRYLGNGNDGAAV